ncbi:hypothetical protein D9M71_649600 [compost metagenome]
MFDQPATDAQAPLRAVHVQVLQVAGILDAPVGTMVDEVDHAHRLAIDPGQCRMGRLVRVEQALPGTEADFIGQLGFVEVQVGLPQGEPGGMVLGGDRAQGNAGHGAIPSELAHVRRELIVLVIGAGAQAFAHAGDILPRAVLAELARALQAGDGQADADDGAEHAVKVVSGGVGDSPRFAAALLVALGQAADDR